MSKRKSRQEQHTFSLLVLSKGKHKYFVKYDPSRKEELFDLLLGYGQSKDYNLTSFDALAIIERLANREVVMESSGSGASIMSLSEGEPRVERDLTFENLAMEENSEETQL